MSITFRSIRPVVRESVSPMSLSDLSHWLSDHRATMLPADRGDIASERFCCQMELEDKPISSLVWLWNTRTGVDRAEAVERDGAVYVRFYWLSGGTVTLDPGFDADACLDAIERFRDPVRNITYV